MKKITLNLNNEKEVCSKEKEITLLAKFKREKTQQKKV